MKIFGAQLMANVEKMALQKAKQRGVVHVRPEQGSELPGTLVSSYIDRVPYFH